MTTLSDCVREYEKQIEEQERRQQEEEAERHEKAELFTVHAMMEIGIEYSSIGGQSVFIENEGEIIHLHVWKAKYQTCFTRILGKCPKCGDDLRTEVSDLSHYSLGAAMLNPQQQYHHCEDFFPEPKTPAPKSIEDKLADALREYIDDRIAQATNV